MKDGWPCEGQPWRKGQNEAHEANGLLIKDQIFWKCDEKPMILMKAND